MTKAGISLRQILPALREVNPNIVAVYKTIYNVKAKIVKESLGGRSMIDALFEECGRAGFTYNLREFSRCERQDLSCNSKPVSRNQNSTLQREDSCTSCISDPFLQGASNTCVSVHALGLLHQQFEMALSDSILPPCTGHFSSTMGLPCAHKMKTMMGEPLQLSDIHYQWRIDGISLDVSGENSNGTGVFKLLLQGLEDKYQCLPLCEKENVVVKLSQYLNTSTPLLLEPIIQPRKGRPTGSRKRKTLHSTRRDPSAFEIAEKSRRCSIRREVTHNKNKCPSRIDKYKLLGYGN